jgi:hypothetical protein
MLKSNSKCHKFTGGYSSNSPLTYVNFKHISVSYKMVNSAIF